MKGSIKEFDSLEVETVVTGFRLKKPVVCVARLGEGLINQTLLLQMNDGRQYVLQRVNQTVFPRPTLLMQNLCRVLAHLRAKGRRSLELIKTDSGDAWITDARNRVWRCFRYLGDSQTFSLTNAPAIVYAAAHAFGQFIVDLSDLPEPALHEVIPGFHDTPARFRSLERAVKEDQAHRAATAVPEIEALLSRQELSDLFARPAQSGELPRRNVHNDTKLNNVLFRRNRTETLCVIDLDTVMPGLVLHDVGDMIRSAASTRAESQFPALDLRLFESLAEGYLSATGTVLTPAERYYLPDCPRVMTLELALRFLVDHLQGDQYFRIEYPGQNLQRCRSQLALLTDMDAKADRMRAVWETSLADHACKESISRRSFDL